MSNPSSDKVERNVKVVELRRRILEHAMDTDSPSGPVYVRCHCTRCVSDLKALELLLIRSKH